MMSLTDKAFLSKLAQDEIERIKAMKQPVVRVCGPLTCDGPEGYERNARRLEMAEEILKQKGFTVWDFGESEKHLKDRDFKHDDVMHYFHEPVMESGLFEAAYFLPRWDESTGATKERHFAERIDDIDVREFPEEWFNKL